MNDFTLTTLEPGLNVAVYSYQITTNDKVKLTKNIECFNRRKVRSNSTNLISSSG